MFRSFRRLWCRSFHSAIMLPIHGRYLCAVCLEEYEFPSSAHGSVPSDATCRVAPSGAEIGALNLDER